MWAVGDCMILAQTSWPADDSSLCACGVCYVCKRDILYCSMGNVEAHHLTFVTHRRFSPPSCKSGASNLIRVRNKLNTCTQQALTIIDILFFLEQSRKCNKRSLLNPLLPRIQLSFPSSSVTDCQLHNILRVESCVAV